MGLGKLRLGKKKSQAEAYEEQDNDYEYNYNDEDYSYQDDDDVSQVDESVAEQPQDHSQLEKQQTTSKNSKKFTSKEKAQTVVEGVRFFHGPIKFNFFKFPVFISTAKQIGFFAIFVVLVVMGFSTYATFTGLNHNKNMASQYENKYAKIVTNNEIYTNLIEEYRGFGKTSGVFRPEIYDEDSTLDGIYRFNDLSVNGINLYYIKFSIMVEDKNGHKVSYQFTTMPMYDNVNNDIINNYAVSSTDSTKKVFDVYYRVNEDQEVVVAINKDYNCNTDQMLMVCSSLIDFYTQGYKVATISVGILIAIIVFFVALAILLVVRVVKHSKRIIAVERAKEEAEMEEARALLGFSSKPQEKKYKFCEYCGERVAEDDKVCPSCGCKR